MVELVETSLIAFRCVVVWPVEMSTGFLDRPYRPSMSPHRQPALEAGHSITDGGRVPGSRWRWLTVRYRSRRGTSRYEERLRPALWEPGSRYLSTAGSFAASAACHPASASDSQPTSSGATSA